MICYLGMTFCPFHETCVDPCGRALTDEVKAAADKWWGDCEGEAPIAVFVDIPACHDGEGK